MADKKGRMTLSEVQALTLPEILALDEATLRKVGGVIRDAANKRYKRLMNSTAPFDTRAQRRFEAGAGEKSPLMYIKGLKGDDLRKEVIRGYNFVNAKTSTLRAARQSRRDLELAIFGETTEQRQRGKSKAEQKRIQIDAERRTQRVFELYRKFEDNHPAVDLDSDFIMMLAGQWARMEQEYGTGDQYMAFDLFVEEQLRIYDEAEAANDIGGKSDAYAEADEMYDWLVEKGLL